MTTSSSITPKPTLAYYKAGVSWAGRDFTVIPGGVDKRPLVKWKRFVRPEQQVPSRQDRVGFRVKGLDHQVSPLLLLDSPSSEALCLCVIDIDDMSAKRDVLAWLLERGYKSALQVSTGREGGGEHLYFLREAEQAGDYRSGQAKPFGKGADGKYRVDLKARNSYAVCPGAVHKSGKTYRAHFSGEEVEYLEDVLPQLPTMKLEHWRELHAYVAGETSDDTEYVAKDARWLQVIEDGRERQPCPWCQRGGDRVLHWKGGAAHCYFEQKTRKAKTRHDKQLEVVDAALQGLADGPQDDDTLSPLQEALRAAEELVPALELDPFPDGDPLADWTEEAKLAALTADAMSLFDRPLACSGSSPTTIIAHGKKSTLTKTCCWTFACDTCGPRLMECLKIAIICTVKREGGVSNLKGDLTIRLQTPSVSVVSADYTTKAWNDGLVKRLRRWAESHPGFGWLAVRTVPDQVHVIMWGDAPDWAEWSGPLERLTVFLLNQIDLGEWRAWKERQEAEHLELYGTKKSSRIKVLLAPANMKRKVHDLMNFLTGRKRKGLSSARALITDRIRAQNRTFPRQKCESDDFRTITTYKVGRYKKFVRDTLRYEVDWKVNEAGANFNSVTAELPCSSVQVLEEFIEANPDLHANTGKSMTAKPSTVSDLIDEIVG